MSNQEILTKAIEKAKKNGFKEPKGSKIKGVGGYDGACFVLMNHGHHVSHMHDWEALVFDHSFAKALWGDMSYAELKGAPYSSANITRQPKAWQYHLQMMVIAKDPIKYLEENI